MDKKTIKSLKEMSMDELREAASEEEKKKREEKIDSWLQENIVDPLHKRGLSKLGSAIAAGASTAAEVLTPEEGELAGLPMLKMGKLLPKALTSKDTIKLIKNVDPEKLSKVRKEMFVNKLKAPRTPEENREIFNRSLEALNEQSLAFKGRPITLREYTEEFVKPYEERLTDKIKGAIRRQEEYTKVDYPKKTGGAITYDEESGKLTNIVPAWARTPDVMDHEHIHNLIQRTAELKGKEAPEAIYAAISDILGPGVTEPLNRILKTLKYEPDKWKGEYLSTISDITSKGKGDKYKKYLYSGKDSEDSFRRWQTKAKRRFKDAVDWLNNMDNAELETIIQKYKSK